MFLYFLVNDLIPMTKFKSDSSVKRVAKNGAFSAIQFGIFTLSGIVFIPFLIRQYGAGTYGLIALAGFLTQYVGLISNCIGGSIARFLNISLNKNDPEQANQIFSTAIVVNIALACLQLPFFAFGLWKLHWVIDFPPEQSLDFRILVACNIVVYLTSLLFGILDAPIQASNRLDIGMKLGMIGQFLRLGFLFGLILRIGPKLWIIGVVDLGIAILGIIATFLVYRKIASQLVFRRRYVDWKWVRPMMNMAGWSIVATLGQVFFLKTDVWIVNRFVDPKLAGVCAALLIWPNFVQQIAKNISALITPVFMIDYAHGRFERIQDITMLFSRLFSILAIFVCGFIMIFGGWLLELWMGVEYRQYHLFLVLMLLHFPLTLAREAIWGVFPAFNKMHYLGISNLISGCMNVALSLLAVLYGFGLTGVIIATGISLILQRTFFLSYFIIKMLNIHWIRLFKCYVPGSLIMLVFIAQYFCFGNRYLELTGIFSVVIAVLFSLEVLVREKESRTALKSIVMALAGNKHA